METAEKSIITVEATIRAPIEKVWAYWNEPNHITKWCFASNDWHAPKAESDLRVGGSFTTRMEAKDGSFGFEFGGIYDVVDLHQFISYTLADTRKVEITFKADAEQTHIIEKFEAESENPLEMQQGGWQMILNNFKSYAETQYSTNN